MIETCKEAVKKGAEVVGFISTNGLEIVIDKMSLETLIAIGFVIFAVIVLIIWEIVRRIKKVTTRRAVQNFFGISDLSKFKIRKPGKTGAVYYPTETMNCYNLNLPVWKKANDDGSRKKTLLNRVIWKESILWLYAGRKIYVLTTKDPWEMLYLVHFLRDSGLDIAPCQQEVEKQEKMDREKMGVRESIEKHILPLENNRMAFVNLCRQRLQVRGYVVSDAPMNHYGIDLFVQGKGYPKVVKCLLVSSDHMTGIEDMKKFKRDSKELFAEAAILITTGNVTVAAAGYAIQNDVTFVCNEELVELLEEDEIIPTDKEFLRWEIRVEDLQQLLPPEISSKDLKRL